MPYVPHEQPNPLRLSHVSGRRATRRYSGNHRDRLAILFLAGAGGDPAEARNAARSMLAAYHPETEDELVLAAEVISFGFHALEALSQAAAPDLSLNAKLRLRGSAVSLSREAHKSQRTLRQLHSARRAGSPTASAKTQPQPVAAERPRIDKVIAIIEQAHNTARSPGQTWTQGYQQRQLANRMIEKLKKNEILQASDLTRLAALEAAAPGAVVARAASA